MMEGYSRSIRAVDEVFRRLAFGINGKGTPNTSTATAYGLILNYFDRVFGGSILPDILKAETLQGSLWDTKRYPQAALLHSYLLRRCRLEPGLLGLWGREVVRRIRRFWRVNPWRLKMIVRSSFGGYGAKKAWGLIKREVNSDRPVMISTTYRRAKSKGEFFPTMVVCGYRVTAFGQREVLVHTGRYGDSIKGSRAQLLYIPLRYVMCSYRFDVVLRNH
jgi:hypothetical protein